MNTNDPSKIGQDLFYGNSGRGNYRKAFPYLLAAATRGDVHTQNLVGYCYDLGLGVTKDKSKALFWYRKAAKAQHQEALFNLAILYEKGQNHRKAFSLYKRAAESGFAPAQCNLAVSYLEGLGTKQDLAKGIEWMRRAARLGDEKAQYNLGMEYLYGDGVRVNERIARLWLEKAAKQRHKDAIKAIQRLNGS